MLPPFLAPARRAANHAASFVGSELDQLAKRGGEAWVFKAGHHAIRVEHANATQHHRDLAPALAAWAPSGTCMAPTTGPLVVPGACVTVWAWAQTSEDVPWGERGELVARFHAAVDAAEPQPQIGSYEPFKMTKKRLRRFCIKNTDEALGKRLSELVEQLDASVPSLPTALGAGIVHGDVTSENVMVLNGTPLLIDYGSIGVAAREVDLAGVIVAAATGEIAPAQRDAFLAGYGQSGDMSGAVPLAAMSAAMYYLTDGAGRDGAQAAFDTALRLADRSWLDGGCKG